MFAKKLNRNGHFECIKKHKITPRSCCLNAIKYYSDIGSSLSLKIVERVRKTCDNCTFLSFVLGFQGHKIVLLPISIICIFKSKPSLNVSMQSIYILFYFHPSSTVLTNSG